MGEAAELRGRRAPVSERGQDVVHERMGDDVQFHGGARIARRSGWYTAPFEGTMRLSSDEIQFISRKIVKTLVAARRLEVDDEARVVDGIARVIVDELSIEDRLNEEAREVLSQHMTHMERSDITYSEMFKKVKRELAKKKGIVL
jgi:hypothetical protein